ncbi:MAG: VOC family protein, partial [Actinomycetota bacterium]
MGDALGILGVDNMMLTVGDMAVAKRFYGEILGLEVKFDASEFGIMAYRLGAEEPGLILRLGDVP